MVSRYSLIPMAFIQSNDSVRIESAGAALSVDTSNPVHLLYAGAAVITGATVLTSVAVTTIAAPGLVLVPAVGAAAMAAGAAYMNDRTDDARSDGDVTPASV
jgi:hypothetical protein